MITPIPVGLTFDYFLWGGPSDALPLKLALIDLKKDIFGKLSKNHLGFIYIPKMSKNAIYLAKNAVKNQTCFFLSEISII